MRKRIFKKIKNLEKILDSYKREKRRLKILKEHYHSIEKDFIFMKHLKREQEVIDLQNSFKDISAKIMEELMQKMISE